MLQSGIPFVDVGEGQQREDCPGDGSGARTAVEVRCWSYVRFGIASAGRAGACLPAALPDRLSATLASWLCAHPGAQIVCRDGSSAYAEAVRDGVPKAVHINDLWHLWHGLGEAVERMAVSHAACWQLMATEEL